MFHGIYEQQINKGKAGKVIIGFFIIVGVVTLIATGITTFNELDRLTEKPVIEQTEKKPKPLAKKKEKTSPQIKKKTEKKEAKKPEIKKRKKKLQNLFFQI